ncbi:hypothetical protein HYH02_010913 [Chlamydomonas schloesseri]|uniref:SET domain-containing protein n=1 Tax=Chlamydomonas schloesseri TaxID=2026947 RepID=A0A835T422_9CHLO|nr:hypothetical protein HYH02_010913 [Chlamydomonas schloesseri]|eukprot:KAG2438459.1 hypothetical protein HYH02_010913 [Chlamydomonas schloesseri]
MQRGGRVDGATLANLAGRDGGSGWGLKAVRDVHQGHRLITLPSGCHLTYGANDDPRLLALIDKVPSELWGAKLALQLIAQRLQGGESQFASYIAELPKGFPGIPMFFPRTALDMIDYPPCSQQVKKRCKWLYEFSTDVLAKLPGSPEDPFGGVAVDINALGWALAAVSSRAFRTRGPTHPAAMLPLIDMANHTFSPNAEVLPLEGGGGAVGLFARRAIAEGEPLLLSYGKLSNDFLFMDYGFIVEDNPYDTVQLRFDVNLLQAGALVSNVSDALGAPLDLAPRTWQLQLLAELGLVGPAANPELNIGGGGPGAEVLDGRLLAAARVMVARAESEVAGRGVERLCAVDRPLGRDNELAALRTVGGVLAFALSNFVTTLEQDKALLVGQAVAVPQPGGAGERQLQPPASEDEMLAVRFRLEKKKILSRALQRVGALSQAAAGNAELKQTAGSAAAKKGSKPSPATSKGFGSKKP